MRNHNAATTFTTTTTTTLFTNTISRNKQYPIDTQEVSSFAPWYGKLGKPSRAKATPNQAKLSLLKQNVVSGEEGQDEEK